MSYFDPDKLALFFWRCRCCSTPDEFWYPRTNATESQSTPHIFEADTAIAVTATFLDRVAGGGSLLASFDVNPTSGVIARNVFGAPPEVGGYTSTTGAESFETSYSSLPSPPTGSPPDFADANASVVVDHIAAAPDGSFKMIVRRVYSKATGGQRYTNLGFDLWSLSSTGTWSFGERYEPFGTIGYPTSPTPTFPITGQPRVALDSSGNVYCLVPKVFDTIGSTTYPGFVASGVATALYTFNTSAEARFLGINTDGTLLACGSDLDGAGGEGLLALDTDGTVLWTYGTNIDIHGAAADTNGNVLVVGNLASSATAALLDPDGDELWTYSAGGYGVSCIIAKDGSNSVVAFRSGANAVTLAYLDDAGTEIDTLLVDGTFADVSIAVFPPPVWTAGKHEVFDP